MPFLVSGVGDMFFMGVFFGSKLLREGMGRKERVGTLVKLGVVMRLVFEKSSRKHGISFLVEPPLKWSMAKGLSFGQTDGMGKSPCVGCFLLYML